MPSKHSEAKLFEREMVRGWLHEPEQPNGDALVITHGAGSNRDAPTLRAVAEAFAEKGFFALRCDLVYRQLRPRGSPFPSGQAKDREGLARAVHAMQEIVKGRIFLGGISYGGRQATMIAAERPDLADALMLLSYPLHPPGKPNDLRTAHFPSIKNPALFISGTRDPFGTIDEMRAALKLIPTRAELIEVPGAGHSLKPNVAAMCVERLPLL